MKEAGRARRKRVLLAGHQEAASHGRGNTSSSNTSLRLRRVRSRHCTARILGSCELSGVIVNVCRKKEYPIRPDVLNSAEIAESTQTEWARPSAIPGGRRWPAAAAPAPHRE